MIERRDPTHTLVIEVPLYHDSEPRDYDPLQVALRTVLHVSRLAVDGVLCGEVTVTLRDEPGG